MNMVILKVSSVTRFWSIFQKQAVTLESMAPNICFECVSESIVLCASFELYTMVLMLILTLLSVFEVGSFIKNHVNSSGFPHL